MKPMLRRGLWVLLLAALLAPVVHTTFGQTSRTHVEDRLLPLQFDRLTIEDGLTQMDVHAILQDRQGFVWFATQHGLNRYDGTQIRAYKPIAFDTTSLPEGFVTALYEDENGFLWVGTRNGALSRMDRATGAFDRVKRISTAGRPRSNFRGMLSIRGGRGGSVWAATSGGLLRFDPATNRLTTFTNVPGDSTSLGNNIVLDLHEGPDGAVWVATGNGVHRLDSASGRFTRYLAAKGDPDIESTDGSYVFTVVFQDEKSPAVLWFGSESSIVRLDIETRSFSRHLLPHGQNAPSLVTGITSDPTRPEHLWAVTRDGGIYRFDSHSRTALAYGTGASGRHQLTQAETYTIAQDRTGSIWIGGSDGATRFDPGAVGFRRYGPPTITDPRVWSVLEDSKGDLWVGSLGGLDRIDRRTGQITTWRHNAADPAGLGSDYVMELTEDRNGTVWIGTWGGGLSRLDPETERLTHYRHDPHDSSTLGSDFVGIVYEGRDGILWIGTRGGGLNRLDPATGVFRRFSHHEQGEDSPEGDFVLRVYQDASNTFWVTTYTGGLSRFDPGTGRFTPYRHNPSDPTGLGDESVYAIHERAREPGVLWLGLASAGLDRFDTRSGTFRHFTERDGLPDGSVYDILEDEDGRLWMSTNSGLTRFDPETQRFVNFGLEKGLQSMEFNQAAAFRSLSGEMFFGGINGVNVFRPSEIRENPYAPPVAITGLRLFNEPASVGAVLQKAIWDTESVRLRHDQNMVTFEFAAFHFESPLKNQYAYRLEPLEDAWVDAGARRLATYTNLAPGQYIFRVKAANSDGVWNEEGAFIQLTILPPWWRTVWAYIGYGLLFVAGIVAVDRLQRRRILQREREAARERELAQKHQIEQAYHELRQAKDRLVQQEKMASLGALTAGIAHEIKNPLNFINNFASLSKELADELDAEIATESPTEDLRPIVDDLRLNVIKIEEHGKRADGIVRSMLEHSRGSRGVRETVDFNAFVDDYLNLAYHGMRAQVPDFNVTLDRSYDRGIGEAEIVPQEMGRVLLNLLNNAFQAVQEKAKKMAAHPLVATNGHEMSSDAYVPAVCVSTMRTGNELEIRIGDNGPGIPETIREKIFEPFFTTKPPGEGTGLGLSLSYGIVTQGHGGKLEIESEDGAGTTFVISLPA